MNGNIGRMNESILLSFAVAFQIHACLEEEGAHKRESEQDHPGIQVPIMERYSER
jgi:hypothetical protein